MDPQRQRTDVYANVSRIVAAARALFSTEGASVTLAEIARRAGVGIATLYRHFPNRQALALAVYETVYHAEIAPLIVKFQQSGTPREELLDLTERLIDVLHQQWGLISSLDDLTAVTSSLLSSRDDAFATMVQRAQAAGNLRDDITATDIPPILAMLTTALSAVDLDPAARRRYLGMLLDGLNPQHANPLPTTADHRSRIPRSSEC
jgi:AcrR family transcriptional regulator